MSEQTVAAGRGVAQPGSAGAAGGTTFAVILSLSFCHFLNDMMQSLVPALPMRMRVVRAAIAAIRISGAVPTMVGWL